MTVSELRTLHQQQRFKEAEILHDVISPGWIVEFRGQDGRLYEMTDTLGCPVSFASAEDARAHIHLVADCPIQVEHLFHFFER